jgi:hypothetical protein
MKKLFTIILIIACSHTYAQDSLKTFNNNRTSITSTGMEVLGGWAIANIGVGAIGWNTAGSNEARYFYQMNILWNTVNFGAALIGYTGTQNNKNKKLTAAETLKQQQKIERTFLINGGLDVAYLGTGLYLKLTGDSRNSPIRKGYGSAILLQGTFLLIFDGIMYNAEKHNGSKLRHFLEKNPVTFDGRRVGIIFNM